MKSWSEIETTDVGSAEFSRNEPANQRSERLLNKLLWVVTVFPPYVWALFHHIVRLALTISCDLIFPRDGWRFRDMGSDTVVMSLLICNGLLYMIRFPNALRARRMHRMLPAQERRNLVRHAPTHGWKRPNSCWKLTFGLILVRQIYCTGLVAGKGALEIEEMKNQSCLYGLSATDGYHYTGKAHLLRGDRDENNVVIKPKPRMGPVIRTVDQHCGAILCKNHPDHEGKRYEHLKNVPIGTLGTFFARVGNHHQIGTWETILINSELDLANSKKRTKRHGKQNHTTPALPRRARPPKAVRQNRDPQAGHRGLLDTGDPPSISAEDRADAERWGWAFEPAYWQQQQFIRGKTGREGPLDIYAFGNRRLMMAYLAKAETKIDWGRLNRRWGDRYAVFKLWGLAEKLPWKGRVATVRKKLRARLNGKSLPTPEDLRFRAPDTETKTLALKVLKTAIGRMRFLNEKKARWLTSKLKITVGTPETFQFKRNAAQRMRDLPLKTLRRAARDKEITTAAFSGK